MRAMRWSAMVVAGTMAMGLAGGCEEQPTGPAPVDVEEGPGRLEGALEGAERTMEQGRDRAVSTAEQQLEAMRGQIDSLKERAESQGARLDEQWPALRTRLEEGLESAETRLSELRDADAGAWQRVSNGLQESMQELRQAYTDASSYLQEKLGGA